MWIFTPLLILGDQINFVLDLYWNKDNRYILDTFMYSFVSIQNFYSGPTSLF